MACSGISINPDGVIFCHDTKPPTEIGPVNHPPTDFSQVQIDAVNFWHRITSGLSRMDRMFQARVALTAVMKEPEAGVDIFFAVPLAQKNASERLDAEIKMLVTDFNDVGCALIYYPPTIIHSRPINRRGDPVGEWVPSDFSWQVTMRIPESRWGDDDVYACLKKLIHSVRRTKLSNFLAS